MMKSLGKKSRHLCSVLNTLVVILAVTFFFVVAVHGQVAEQKTTTPQKAPAPQAPESIPLADIATRATEVSNLLRHVNTLLDPSPQIETIQKLLPEASRNIELEFSETKKVLQGQPTLAALQSGQQLWEKRQLEMTAWLNLLTKRATQLETALNQLAELEKMWSHTLDAAKAPRAPEPILQQIDATIAGVETVQTPIQTQLSAVLDLQSRVAQEVTWCGTALAEIGEAQQKAVGGLLKRETPP
ncbi:MAG: hypothetical protein MUO38_07610, partial [Anaerolineales bacterium]|nr:hypothetical protein [Anaerolineales bacterium]